MPGKAGSQALLLLACLVSNAQRTGSTSLLLQINPEARIDPQQVALNFRVSADGASDVTTQAANVTAWVRALRGQQIRVTAQLASPNGPNGPVSAAVRWSGSTTRATAGARAATCSSGTLQSSAAGDLVLGWQESGILTCAINFDLVSPRSLPPGLYSGTVQLTVTAR